MAFTLGTRFRWRPFLFLSPSVTALFCLFAQASSEVIVIWGIYLLSLLNLFMGALIVRALIGMANVKGAPNKGRIFLYSLGKLLLIVAGLGFGVLFMHDRIVIPVLNHVVQIHVFCFCFLRKRPISV